MRGKISPKVPKRKAEKLQKQRLNMNIVDYFNLSSMATKRRIK
jgi:hypothetical protein